QRGRVRDRDGRGRHLSGDVRAVRLVGRLSFYESMGRVSPVSTKLRRRMVGVGMVAMLAVDLTSATAAAAVNSSIWNSGVVPLIVDPDAGAVEVGVRFRSDTAGFITGLRFYKFASNTGTHIGNVWTNSGTLLATATFTGESTSGWQVVTFASPVA